MGKYVRPQQRQILSTHVVASKQISPNFVRITLGGPALGGFSPMGYDHWFRLFLPGNDGTLRLPTKSSNLGWYAQYLMMSKDSRPLVRNYTVRDYRATGQFSEGPELDIDFVAHGDQYPASAWATRASSGDPVGLLDEGITYQAKDGDTVLIAGEESALPAIAGILSSVPRTVRGEVFLEVGDAGDQQEFDAPEGVTIHWLARGESTATPGTLALEKLTSTTLAQTPSYVWAAGEQQLAAGVRRHAVSLGVAKSAICFTGYWRLGKSAGQM